MAPGHFAVPTFARTVLRKAMARTPNSLRAARIRADLTQVELARISGVARNAIIRLENGPAGPRGPHAATKRMLAMALGCGVEELFPGNGARKPVRKGPRK